MDWLKRWRCWIDEMDVKLARPFHPALFFWVANIFGLGLVLGFSAGTQHSLSAAIATYGAFVACCGIITLGRPMIRMGGYKEWLRRSKTIGGEHFVPTSEDLEEGKQQEKDALAVQIIGPALAVVGTMTNGISGLF